MTLKYESEILFDLMKRDGDDAPSDVLPYESELKEKYLEQVEGAYPKLQDYRSEWLNYNLNAQLPAEFPYITISNVTNATVDNVVPYSYRSAILKGSTKYRDIDTGEVLDAFEDGRNLELVSVKMPVLTTTGKNLFDGKLEYGLLNSNNGLPINSNEYVRTQDFIPINCEWIAFTVINEQCGLDLCFYDKDKNFISHKLKRMVTDDLSIPEGTAYLKFRTYPISNESVTSNLNTQIQIEVGSTATTYEPYKSNILTVNEDVTLRSNGDICDELNLLTEQLTQRIGEDGVVLSQEVDKTVELSCINEQGESVTFRPIEGTMHVSTSSQTLPPLLDMSVPVEAITQNLMSFANIEEEE